ncbi:MAG: hypothetical protein U0359_36920 [Byssovorax sp.]
MQCATHPELPAHNACSRCGSALCDACVKTITVTGRDTQSARLATCDRCGGLVQAIPGALRTTEGEDLRELVRRPFERDNLLAVIALSIPWGLTALPSLRLKVTFGVIYFAALSMYYFQVIDHIGQGKKDLPFSADLTSGYDVLRSLTRGVIVVGILLGPALYLAWIGAPGVLPPLLALAFGLLCAPASILSIVLTGHAANGLWPIVWAQIIARAPRDYLKLVGFFSATFVGWWVFNTAAFFFLAPIPWFGFFLSGLCNTMLTLVQALFLGHFLRRNAHRFQ